MKYLIAVPEKYWVLADQVLVSGSGFVTSLLLARALGVAEFGRFSGIAMVQLFLLSVTMAFTSQVYQVVSPLQTKAQARLFTSGLLVQLLWLAVLLLLVAMVLCATMPAFSGAAGTHTRAVVLLSGLSAALFLLQDFLRRAFITHSQARLACVTDALNNLLQLAGLAIAWYYHALTLVMACGIIALSFIPAVVTGIALLKAGRLTVAAAGFAWHIQKTKSGWLLGSALLQWGAGYFFVVAAGWYLGAAALGALRLAQYLFGLLNVLLAAMESYALPRVAAQAAGARSYCLQLLKKSLLVMMPLLLLPTVFARQVLVLAGGPQYAQYAFIMYGLSVVYLFITAGYSVRIAIRSQHLHQHYFNAYALSVLVSIPVAPWLLQHWQLYGVLCGLLLTQVICIGYWLIILQRKNAFLWK